MVKKKLCALLLAVMAVGATSAAAQEGGAASLVILGADGQGLSYKTASSHFSGVVQLENRSQADIADVRVLFGPLFDDAGTPIALDCKVNGKSCDSEKLTVPAMSRLRLSLEAALGGYGAYKGALTHVQGGASRTTNLTITRAAAATPFEVLGLDTVAIELRPWPFRGRPTFWVTIHETAGRSLKLGTPQFIAFTRQGPEQQRLQAEQRVEIIDPPSTNGAPELGPGGELRVKLAIDGLDEPGVYEGTLRFSGADVSAADKPVRLVVKASWLCAAILIALGVGLSALLRFYAQKRRAQLLVSRRIAVTIIELDQTLASLGALSQAELAVAQPLRRDLETLNANLGFLTEERPGDKVDMLAAKVALLGGFILIGRRLAALKPPSLAEAFLPRIQKIKNDLVSPMTPLGVLQTDVEELHKLPTEITAAVRKDLTEQVSAFRKELEAQRAELGGDVLGTAEWIAVGEALSQVDATINADDLAMASAAFEKARRSDVDLLARRLREALLRDAPSGVDGAEYAAMQARVRASLDGITAAMSASAALGCFQAAHSYYLETLARAFLATAKSQLSAIAASSNPEAQAEAKQQLTSAIAKIEESQKQIGALNLREAARMLESARETLAALRPARGDRMGGPTARTVSDSTSAPISSGAMLPQGITDAPIPFSAQRSPSVAEIEQRIQKGDFFVDVVIALVSVLIGLKLFFIDKGAWGGGSDYLAAFFWGLGVHNIAATTESFASTRQKLTS